MEKNIYQEIKKLKTVNEANNFKNEINKIINEQIEQIKTDTFISSFKDRNFGYIKENFENLSEELFKTKKGRATINKYIKCIKESKDLTKMHQMYECVRKADKDGDVNAYLNEAVSLIGNINKDAYSKSLSKLAGIFSDAYRQLCENNIVLNNNAPFYDSVEFIMFNRKTPKNLAEYNSRLSTVKKHILEGAGYEIKESKNVDELTDNLMEDFNTKYSQLLDNDVVTLVKEVFSNDDKENIFNKYKEQCINKLNETKRSFEKTGDNDSSERINTIIERIDKKVYNPDTVNNDLYNLIEISSIE